MKATQNSLHLNKSARQERDSKPCHGCGQKIYTASESCQTDEAPSIGASTMTLYFHHENPRILGNRNCWNIYKEEKRQAGKAEMSEPQRAAA